MDLVRWMKIERCRANRWNGRRWPTGGRRRTAAGSPDFAEMAVRGTDSGAGWPGSELERWRTPLGVRDEAPKTGGRCSPAGRLGGSMTSDCAREEPREREGKVASGVPYPALELRRWLVGTRKERGGGSSGGAENSTKAALGLGFRTRGGGGFEEGFKGGRAALK